MLLLNILPPQETLVSVATWLEHHPKEIVILACSHFEGMHEKRHKSFILALKKLFGSKLCPQKVSVLFVRLIYMIKTTRCLITSDLPSSAVCPDLEESVGIWLPGHSVL